MQAFLNELSLPFFENAHHAKALFDSLGFLYKNASENGIKEIKVKASFFEHEFAKDYSFNSWVYDKATDSDLRTLLIGVLTTTPFIDDIFVTYEKTNEGALEMYCENQKCFGLGLASDLVYDTIAFSYDNGKWGADTYGVLIKTLEVDDLGNFVEDEKKGAVRNVTTNKHFQTHLPFLQEKIKNSVTNGNELWMRKADLFPGLEFCASVQSQISGMDSSSPEFQQILNRLFELQNFTRSWDGSAIKPADFKSKVTPESETRLNKFNRQLTIACPDGNNRLFSWHARYTPGAGRVHFIPNQSTRKLLIGSIANQNVIK